jgi:lanthanide-dependent methanol dehydrogenase
MIQIGPSSATDDMHPKQGLVTHDLVCHREQCHGGRDHSAIRKPSHARRRTNREDTHCRRPRLPRVPSHDRQRMEPGGLSSRTRDGTLPVTAGFPHKRVPRENPPLIVQGLPATAVALLLYVGPAALADTPPQPPPAAFPPEDGTWRMPAKDSANTRYSGLDEITRDNVKSLQVAYTFSTGVARGQESAPIVVGDTLYFVSPYPNILYALDLTKPGAPIKWQFNPQPDAASQGEACCDTVNRGPTFDGGKIFFNTLDGHAIALDAATGKPVWKVKLADYTKGETMTMAPFVAKNKVLIGNSGGEFGVRGWLTALDEDTGKIAWRAYSTGPDADCLIGTDYRPFYQADRGLDLGVHTWPPDAWKVGGGAVWGWISYDPDLNRVYYGTSNPGPWNADVRPGDNKYTGGVFARDLDTGAAEWFYQVDPHDLFDHDAVNESILLDMTWQGQPRKVMVRPERNGLIYVIDRTNGEVLAADPYVPVNSNKGVDLKTGRLIYVDDRKPIPGRVIRDICPSAPGSKDWNPSAYSPQTGLLYVPHNNMCMDWESTPVSYIAGTPYVGADVKYHAGPGGNRGEMTGWDPVRRRKAWSIPESFPLWSGAAATAGGVVFYGTLEGWFKAVDAATGAVLWQFKTGSGIIGQPTVFRGPDGHEYVAVLSGVGGWAGAIVSADLDPRDETAGNGWGSVLGDLKSVTTKGGMLYVFTLVR